MNTRMRLVALILILITPTWAAAAKFDQNVKFKDLGPVTVLISDEATGGCWTNMKEAKNYAEGQLDMVGATLVDKTEDAAVALDIFVSAERFSSFPQCYGSVIIQVARSDKKNNVTAVITYSSVGQIAAFKDNLNIMVLDLIKMAVAEWR